MTREQAIAEATEIWRQESGVPEALVRMLEKLGLVRFDEPKALCGGAPVHDDPHP
jgi:hypothetical protein